MRRSIEAHAAIGGRIVWPVCPGPFGLLDLQQVNALLRQIRERLPVEAGQLLGDLFAGRAVPPDDVVVGNA